MQWAAQKVKHKMIQRVIHMPSFNISSLAPVVQEPSPLSHVSLTVVLKSKTSSSPPCAPHASVSLRPYSCNFQPSPPALQLQLLRCSRSILTILPTHVVQKFSRCVILSCDHAWIHREDTSLSCTLNPVQYKRVRIHDPGHRATRNAYTTAAGATFLQEEYVWAQTVSISLPRSPCKIQHIQTFTSV